MASTRDIEDPVREQFQSIENIRADDVMRIELTITFQPFISIDAQTDTVFETSVGKIHRITDRDTVLLAGDRVPPWGASDSLKQLITDTTVQPVDRATWEATEAVTDTTVTRFSHAESDFEEWTIDHLQSEYTTTVEYTGDNAV